MKSRSRKPSDERSGGLGMGRRCGDARSEHGDLLRPGREFANDVNAFHRTQLADLLKSDLEFPRSDDPAHGIGGNLFAFGLDLVGNPSFGNNSVER